MVKNQTGGSRAKSQARKNSAPTRSSGRTRVSLDESECYAQVSAYLGDNKLRVKCIDGKTRLCIIRGKFRGRSKSGNYARLGSWLLVGLRDWASGSGDEDCDLLEVYSDADKDKLKDMFPDSFRTFIEADNNIYGTGDGKTTKVATEDNLVFSNEAEDEYNDLIESACDGGGKMSATFACIDEESICIDDI